MFCRRSPIFNPEAVRSACDIFVGTKDFAAVSSKSTERKEANKTTVREVYSLKLEESSPFLPCKELEDKVQFWSFTCKGKSFLFHQASISFIKIFSPFHFHFKFMTNFKIVFHVQKDILYTVYL